MRSHPAFLPLLACALPAQAFVSPAFFTRCEGPTYLSSGIGDSQAPSRLLQIHEDVPAMTVQALAFRRDGEYTTDYAAFSVVMSVSMSTAVTSAAAPDATFDNNHGSDRRTVLANQLVQFPAVPYAGFAAPFDYRIPISTFQYAATGPLCFDLQVVTRSASFVAYMDGAYGADSNPGGLVALIGDGCRVSATAPPAWMTGYFSPNWPARTMTLLMVGNDLPVSQIAALTLGDSASQWGPIALPFELPGTASAPSGPCNVLNSVVLSLPQLTSATGSLSASVGFGVNVSMRGRNVFFQAVAPELAANNWGLVLSNSVQFHPWAPWTSVPVGMVDLQGLGNTGAAQGNQGMMVRFE